MLFKKLAWAIFLSPRLKNLTMIHYASVNHYCFIMNTHKLALQMQYIFLFMCTTFLNDRFYNFKWGGRFSQAGNRCKGRFLLKYQPKKIWWQFIIQIESVFSSNPWIDAPCTYTTSADEWISAGNENSNKSLPMCLIFIIVWQKYGRIRAHVQLPD